jgi:hypothetical protein
MKMIKIYVTISILALAALACNFDFNIPLTTDIKTGPTVTEEIDIPYWGDPSIPAEVTIGFGAGDLFISPGAADAAIQGEVTYNVEDLKPDISINNETISLKTGSFELEGIPNFDEKIKNEWDLTIGSMETNLTIKAGAYNGEFELGGLSLANLHIADGAAEVKVNFQEPNRIEMNSFRYETGASDISLSNLSNANFNAFIFESGAGKYELDFSGNLRRDSNVFITTGLSSMSIIVPRNMNVRLSLEGGLTNVSTRGSWDQSGSYYIVEGEGPILNITIEINAGNLILKNP